MNEKVVNIGVVGEGKMGTAIFLYLLGFDFHLVWLCSSEQAKEEALKLFLKKAGSKLHCGVITEQEHRALLESTLITSRTGDLSECDLIIEAIPEDPGIKKKLFQSLDRVAKPSCIFTSNSSSILPSQIVPSASRTGNFAGLHFFFPIQMKKYVEVIRTTGTSQSTMETLENFLLYIHKIPFRQEEKQAFILNRLFLELQAIGYEIYLEGRLTMKEIDNLVKENLFPLGIFEFFDHVGIDVMLASIRNYKLNSLSHGSYIPLIHKLEELCANNYMGLKTRKGFYDYSLPGSQKRDSSGTRILDDEYRINAVNRLRRAFYESAMNEIQSGNITREFLEEAVNDYAGSEWEPFRKV